MLKNSLFRKGVAFVSLIPGVVPGARAVPLQSAKRTSDTRRAQGPDLRHHLAPELLADPRIGPALQKEAGRMDRFLSSQYPGGPDFYDWRVPVGQAFQDARQGGATVDGALKSVHQAVSRELALLHRYAAVHQEAVTLPTAPPDARAEVVWQGEGRFRSVTSPGSPGLYSSFAVYCPLGITVTRKHGHVAEIGFAHLDADLPQEEGERFFARAARDRRPTIYLLAGGHISTLTMFRAAELHGRVVFVHSESPNRLESAYVSADGKVFQGPIPKLDDPDRSIQVMGRRRPGLPLVFFSNGISEK